MKKLVIAGLTAAVIPFAAMAAGNGSVSDDFTITATVAPYCEITNGAQDVSVNYNPYDSNDVTASATTKFNCVKGTSYNISVTAPTALQGQNTGDSLNISVSPTSNSGADNNGMAGEESFAMTITIPAGQDVSVDTYTGTVTVDISY